MIGLRSFGRIQLLCLGIAILLVAVAPASSTDPERSPPHRAGFSHVIDAEMPEAGSDWIEFVPDWQMGPANVTWQDAAGGWNTVLRIPQGASFATDGAEYLYVTVTSSLNPVSASLCTWRFSAPASSVWVLTSAETCTMSSHPAIACNGFVSPCHQIVGEFDLRD